MTIMYEKLKDRAKTVIRTKDIDKAFVILGQVEMAYELGRISWSQQDELSAMLIDNGVNVWRAENAAD